MKNAFVASVLLAGAAPALAALYSSPDGTCGPNTSYTCKQSFYGQYLHHDSVRLMLTVII
jgi:hypothetical protein